MPNVKDSCKLIGSSNWAENELLYSYAYQKKSDAATQVFQESKKTF